MLLENQKIKVKWNASNKKHYESILNEQGGKKYTWAGRGAELIVDAEDLSKGSPAKVMVKCDYCGKIIKKAWDALNKERMNSEIKKDCCKKCTGIKIREKLGTLDEPLFEEAEKTNNHYSKEFLISEFYRYLDEFGTYPRLVDLKSNKNYPSASGYNKFWGNYSNFLKELDILGEDGWYKEDEEIFKDLYLKESKVCEINKLLIVKKSIYELNNKAKAMNLPKRELFVKRDYDTNKSVISLLKDALVDLYNDVGKTPVAMDFDYYTKINKLPSRKNLESTLGMTFSNICLELFSSTNKITKTDEELINDLISLKSKLGRTPLGSELKSYGLAEQKAYMRRFNMSYNELIESLGWELSSSKLKFKTEEELLSDYLKLYNELGRVPNYQDVDDCDYTASFHTYLKYFDSLNNILNILNIEIPCNQEISAGFVGLNKNNEVCRSMAELIISNALIDSRINYIPEMRYSDLDSKFKNKSKMDWYLEDYGVYVEYFGMYQESQINRNTRIGKYSRKVKKKILYCNENNIKLIDLYKSDLDDNYSGLIEKFNKYNINIAI